MYQLWSQDNFSRGELSPYTYAKAQVQAYYNGLRTAQNVLTYPTGAAGKRFGTLFQTTLNNAITASNQIFFETFQWFDNCIFQIIVSPETIYIYLEGINIQTVSNPYDVTTIGLLDFTVIGGSLGAAFRLTAPNYQPMDLIPGPDSGNTITGVSSTFLTVTNTLVVGLVVPIQFTNTGGALPTSNPPIRPGITYFANQTTSNTIEVYADATDAKFRNSTVRFSFTPASGSGTNKVVTYNTWSFSPCVFGNLVGGQYSNLPFYDFNSAVVSYSNINFTFGTAMDNQVTVTLSAPYTPLDSSYIGGVYFANTGAGRIISVADNQHFTIQILVPFDMTTIIQGGNSVLLTEPAWSNKRGWPTKCSSYQSRAFFANTVSLPNGIWGSVINDYTNFGNLTTDDDDAITWFPSSGDVNVIRFIVPFRSLTVHTNTGIYSTPLSDVSAITPTNFALLLQDSTPADVLQPQAIDNQVFVVSGNDCHTMLWDGINNAYTTNIISVPNEQTIRTPIDEATYADLDRAGSRYIFIINQNGSMAIVQTLQAEGVLGINPAIMEQSYGNAQFLQAASSKNGRAWFVVQRQYAVQQSGLNIIGVSFKTPVSDSMLTVTGIQAALNSTGPTAITFTTSSSLPVANPALSTQQYYWGVAVDTNDLLVYYTLEDAIAGVLGTAVNFTAPGASSTVFPWTLNPVFTLEELSQEVLIDCAIQYGTVQGGPASTINTGILFNAQDVVMIGDGFGYETTGFNNQVTFEAHGQPVAVQNAYIGFPINLVIEPMPLSPPPNFNTTLTKPKHIRSIRFMFNNTIGGEINGLPIALNPFDMADIGEPPIPAMGIFEISNMTGWDDFTVPSFTLTQSDPFDIQLLGVFYSVDI